MDLDTLIITVFCTVDDAMKTCFAGKRLRQSGPRPTLEDSEVLTMETVGAFLGISQEQALFAFFGNHYAHFFPALRRIHRTTFTRQAANLWKVKERLWLHLLDKTPHDERFHIIDSFPLPVCRFARAPRCRCFQGEAAFGHDAVARQTFYGFRFHAVVAWPGVIARLCLAPGNEQELAVAPQLAQGIEGQLIADRNYWSPWLRQELAAADLDLVAPYRNKSKDPWPHRSHLLSVLRYRIDTVFGQLTERFSIKNVGAKDIWHMASRLMRTVLSHTLMVYLNIRQGNEPLQFQHLLAT